VVLNSYKKYKRRYVMEIKLENESLELTINSFGAELKSITGKETGTQYLSS